MTNEKRCLLAISVLMQLIFTFFDVFFGVYIYDISKNLNIIILYTICNTIFFCIVMLALYKFLNKRVITILYRISFFAAIIAIGLTFTIDASRIYMAFITQLMLKLTHIFYYLPHEVATMTINKTSHMKKFLGLSSTLSLLVGFLSPLLSGIIIDFASYFIIFGVLLILSTITLILSLFVSPLKVDTNKYGFSKFIKVSHKIKHIRYSYSSHLFFNLSNDGIVASFLPILIYLNTGTNFSVGLYSAIASVISGIILILYSYYGKNKSIIMWICTILQVFVSLCIIFWSNIVVFFVYYFIKKIVSKILRNGTNETVFTAINNTELEDCKIENFYTYNLYHHAGILIACVISLLVYNLMQNVLSIMILLGAFSLSQIIATIFLNKADKFKASDNLPSNQQLNQEKSQTPKIDV